MPTPEDTSYATLDVARDGGILTVTIDHAPMNLLDATLIADLDRLGRALEADDSARVVLFQSAHPDYFIAHADVSMIQALPSEAPPKSPELSYFHTFVERYRLLPCVTIGVIEGRARGGGSEFLLALDMRFGAIGRCIVGQPEVALGIIPGGGGTQRLARLLGRARALEAILGCGDLGAREAERVGWINRALPDEELRPFVSDLARRIASFPRDAVSLAKRAIDAAEGTTHDGLLEEAHLFNLTLALPEARARMAAFLERGGQDPVGELDLGAVLARLDSD